VNVWDTLLEARAIENLAYSIGVNRIGEDGHGVAFNGHSAAYSFKGEQLIDMGETAQLKTVTLSSEDLIKGREKFPAYLDADKFELK
jgi:predicted amidohydrolase